MKRRKFLTIAAGVVGLASSSARIHERQAAGATTDAARSWLTRLPKVELHVHIEGAVPKTALWQLVTKYGGDPSAPTFEAFERKFDYQGLKQFFQMFDWATGFLREPEDFTFVGREIARDFARQNIWYVEAHFSPTVFRQRLTPPPIAEALRRGLDAVPSVDVRLIAELGRNLGPDGAMRTLEQVADLRALKILVIGLGGLRAAISERALRQGLRARARARFSDHGARGRIGGCAKHLECDPSPPRGSYRPRDAGDRGP
jgi:Adenosine deaminase